MTELQMIEIIKNKTIESQTPENKKKVMVFAFGEEFIASKDEGKVWKS